MLLLALACHDPGESPAPAPRAAAVMCPDVVTPTLSTDTWTAAGPLPAGGLHALATDGAAPIWLASHSMGAWRAGDDLAWEDVLLAVTHNVAEIALRSGDPDHAFRSAGGAVERTRDGGATWTALGLGAPDGTTAPDGVRALAVTPWSPDRVLALHESGLASLSVDDGDTWTSIGYAPVHLPPASEDSFAAWHWRVLPEAAEGGRVVFGDGFGIAVSDDGLRTWTRTLDTPLGGYSLLRDPDDPRHLYVGGPDGLYESRDEGGAWTLRDLGGDVISGAWGDGWLAFVGTNAVYVSDDGGQTFATRPHALTDPGGAAILDDGRLLVVAHTGVAVSTDRGLTWADASEGLEDRGVSVVVPDPTCPARVFAGSRCGGGLFVSEDHGASWQPVHAFFHYFMTLSFEAGRVWAVSDDRLLRSDDGGGSWAEAWRRYHFHGFATHPDDPDQLLLGSVGSGVWADETMRVWASDDGGETWTDRSAGLPASEASAHALLRWPGAPEVVLLGTYKGGDVSHNAGSGVGLFRSEDDGASWAAVEGPTDIAMLAASGTAMFAATNEGIYGSTDAGVTWTAANVTVPVIAIGFGAPGTPGEPVGLALTREGDLWKSTDSGATWVEHDAELPRNPTTDLAQVGVSADGSVGYVTVFDHGVYRIGL